ncbi:hypothetical protein EDB85DRAFT_1898010 [Lactarius pseudohatsudake]|nr:hypothetical protein EDB85DRAFT_1898010 [Lactarius pseudohatsudake]
MSHYKPTGYSLERRSPGAKGLDLPMDVDQETVFVKDDDPMPQTVSDHYCFLCGNGGDLIFCDKCSRAICIGSGSQCLGLPVTSRYKDRDILFICPPCHQDGDRKEREPRPYYGFYVFPGPGAPPVAIDAINILSPAYASPALIRGSAQVIPRSMFSSNGIAVLSFRLESFHADTGDLGKVLEPFANAFFPNENKDLLIFEHITYDLDQSKLKHQRRVHKVAKRLSPLAASKVLKTAIILITTHAADDTGNLGTSSTRHVGINEWMTEVITKPILDVISTLNTHWFFLTCGSLVNVPSSLEGVKSFAHEWKPANLIGFDTPAFHPIYAATFLLNFFHYIVIEDRTFGSAIGLLLNTSPLSRHTGIVRFWAVGSVVKSCTLKWAHSRTQPWGKPVPYQCPSCRCIQAWDQKGQGGSSELRGDVKMRCSYKGENGRCPQCLTFETPSTPYKALKLPEGVWVAFGLPKSDFL